MRRNKKLKKRYETITLSGPIEIADVRELGIRDSYTYKDDWIKLKIYVAGKKVSEKIATLPGGKSKKVGSGIGNIFG